MQEEALLNIIKSVTKSKYIGDDCAYLEELGIVISQDSLVEDVHFRMDYFTPYQLGYKSAMVNISDIAASGSCAEYITVALSLPKNTTCDFVEDFYKGITDALKLCGEIEIIGGDLTGADKIMISVTAIGLAKNVSSRSNAKTGQVIVTSGTHGSSAGGLKLLQKGMTSPTNLVNAHLKPKAQVEFAKLISENITEKYAMMDSSDGLADALFKIATSSNRTAVIDFNKITFEPELKNTFPDNYKELILYGGEDYQLIATVPKEFAKKFNLTIIGYIDEKDTPLIVENYDNKTLWINNLENCYNHFG